MFKHNYNYSMIFTKNSNTSEAHSFFQIAISVQTSCRSGDKFAEFSCPVINIFERAYQFFLKQLQNIIANVRFEWLEEAFGGTYVFLLIF